MNRRRRQRRRRNKQQPGYYVLDSEQYPQQGQPVTYRLPATPTEDGRTQPVIIGITAAQAQRLGYSEHLQPPAVADAWRNRARTAETTRDEAVKQAVADALDEAKLRIVETILHAKQSAQHNGVHPTSVVNAYNKVPRDWAAFCAGHARAYDDAAQAVAQAFDVMTGKTPPPPTPWWRGGLPPTTPEHWPFDPPATAPAPAPVTTLQLVTRDDTEPPPY